MEKTASLVAPEECKSIEYAFHAPFPWSTLSFPSQPIYALFALAPPPKTFLLCLII